jgi:hypothetical protein
MGTVTFSDRRINQIITPECNSIHIRSLFDDWCRLCSKFGVNYQIPSHKKVDIWTAVPLTPFDTLSHTL